MPEKVIITIRYQGIEADIEIPSKVPFGSMEEPLKKALHLQFAGAPLKDHRILLRGENGYLSPDRTPEDYGVFDGTVLELELTADWKEGR